MIAMLWTHTCICWWKAKDSNSEQDLLRKKYSTESKKDFIYLSNTVNQSVSRAIIMLISSFLMSKI